MVYVDELHALFDQRAAIELVLFRLELRAVLARFLDGFAGASALGRIASATGPVGLALAGTAGLGLLAGRKLAEQIQVGMASLKIKDTIAARIGVDDATMARYGTALGLGDVG